MLRIKKIIFGIDIEWREGTIIFIVVLRFTHIFKANE